MEAMAWGKQIVEFMNETYPEATVHVFVARFGQLGHMEWHVDFEDLAALDAYQERVGADETYQEHIRAGQDLLVEGSGRDDVLMAV
jgi:hypothetical protein